MKINYNIVGLCAILAICLAMITARLWAPDAWLETPESDEYIYIDTPL